MNIIHYNSDYIRADRRRGLIDKLARNDHSTMIIIVSNLLPGVLKLKATPQRLTGKWHGVHLNFFDQITPIEPAIKQ